MIDDSPGIDRSILKAGGDINIQLGSVMSYKDLEKISGELKEQIQQYDELKKQGAELDEKSDRQYWILKNLEDKINKIDSKLDEKEKDKLAVSLAERTVTLLIPVYTHRVETTLDGPYRPPEEAVKLLEEGRDLFNSYKYEEALERFYKINKLDPNFSKGWWFTGITLNDLKRYEEAMECFDEALKLNMYMQEAWSGKSTSFRGLGDNEASLRCLEKSAKLVG